jgi:hypothetical protein
MANVIADFPANRFAIHAHCPCGHGARLDLERLPAALTIDRLRARLRCRACGGREIGIRISWTAAGGFAHSAGALHEPADARQPSPVPADVVDLR